MSTKRRKKVTPIALLWTRRDQLRFSQAVERLQTVLNDLVVVVEELKRERVHKRRPRAAATAAIAGTDGEGVMS